MRPSSTIRIRIDFVLSGRQRRRTARSLKFAPVAASDLGVTGEVLVSDDVRQHVAAVQQDDEPALVEVRVALEPVELR